MTEAALRQARIELTGLSDELEDSIKSVKSFDDIRNLSPQSSTLNTSLATAIFNIHLLARAQIFGDFTRSRGESVRVISPRPPRLREVSSLFGAIVLDTDFEPLPFDEAIDYFRRKTNLSPTQFDQLSQAARAKAFTIADGASLQIRSSINDLIDEALSEGISLRDFQSRAAEVLDSAGVSARTPWYWETVYRTNLGNSYEVGRWKQITDPDVVEAFPYLRYVHADPTGPSPPNRATHQAQHGKIYPIGDPFWDNWYPKNGFNCRCTTMQVSEADLARNKDNPAYKFMAARGRMKPDPGFEGNAGKADAV